MYSFRYDEDETWAVWPRRTSLSEFAEGIGKTVVAQVFRRFLADVREQMNNLEDKIVKEKSLLANKMNKLLTAFESYQADVEINEVFARYQSKARMRLLISK